MSWLPVGATCRANIGQYVNKMNLFIYLFIYSKLHVRVEAIQQPYRASGDIVEDAFSITNENDFNLPNQQYLQRAANRIRQKLGPAEPKDLTFEV